MKTIYIRLENKTAFIQIDDKAIHAISKNTFEKYILNNTLTMTWQCKNWLEFKIKPIK